MYKRVLLKLSGEALSGEGGKGFSEKTLTYLVNEVKKIHQLNIKLGIVVGAGNIFRGKELKDFRIQMADQLGMLGTV
ncbi:MAG: Uridylate kinase, partial [Petrotoga mobilis]